MRLPKIQLCFVITRPPLRKPVEAVLVHRVLDFERKNLCVWSKGGGWTWVHSTSFVAEEPTIKMKAKVNQVLFLQC